MNSHDLSNSVNFSFLDLEGIEDTVFFVDVSPLWEINFTGISNVVFELAKRFYAARSTGLDVVFTVFKRPIGIDAIAKTLENRSGTALREAFGKLVDQSAEKLTSRIEYVRKKTVGIYLHTASETKVYDLNAFLIYDLSFYLTPEYHTKDTIDYHTNGFQKQVVVTDLFFCISQATSNDLMWMFNVPQDRVFVTYLGHNADSEKSNKIKLIFESFQTEKYVLVLGTVEPRKNINIILSWLSINPSFLNDYKLVVVGREGWGDSFQNMIKSFNLEEAFYGDKIMHMGYVSQTQKRILLEGASCLIFPSIFEGFGLPVLEAMECGKPVIASCSTSIPEVLGPQGYYFDPYSVDSFDNAVKSWIDDEDNGNCKEIAGMLKKRASLYSYDSMFYSMLSAIKTRLN